MRKFHNQEMPLIHVDTFVYEHSTLRGDFDKYSLKYYYIQMISQFFFKKEAIN